MLVTDVGYNGSNNIDVWNLWTGADNFDEYNFDSGAAPRLVQKSS